MTEPLRLISDRYAIEEALGRGGMGAVHRARDRILDRTVAIKVLPAELGSDDRAAARLRREARAAARLNHPGIVAVFDAGVADGTPYLVMEHVEGHTLAEELADRGSLPPERAATIADRIAEALTAAHAGGVIHRDVKPSNVLLTDRGDVKVADFGIARAVKGDTLTPPSLVMGSAQYLSPEQARGEPGDPRSDVYGLGVVLYEMLAGRPPFEAESTVAVALKHLEEEPSPPSAFQPLPPGLDDVVLRALAKDADRRFPSTEAFRAALRPYAGQGDTLPMISTATASSETGPAPEEPDRSAVRPGRWRWVAAAAAALVVLLSTLWILMLFGAPDSPARPGDDPRPSVSPASPPDQDPGSPAPGAVPGSPTGGGAEGGTNTGGVEASGGSSGTSPSPPPEPSPSPPGDPSPSPPEGTPSPPPPPSPSPTGGATVTP